MTDAQYLIRLMEDVHTGAVDMSEYDKAIEEMQAIADKDAEEQEGRSW